MDYTRETAAQRARLDKVMRAPACSGGSCRQGRDSCATPEACEMQIDFAGDEPSEFLDFTADMAAAGKLVLIWLLVVIACGLAAYLIAAGIDAIEPHWAVAVAMLGV